jgi:HAD superfamily hydrolase (TIGR01509 family)
LDAGARRGASRSVLAPPVRSGVVTTFPAAVLWDMDGTLVDTEPHWMFAETVLVESFGGTWTHEDALTLVGSGLWHSARVLQAHGVKMGEDEIIQHLSARVMEQIVSEPPFRPGARELLISLREHGIKTALVTMSIRSMADHVVRAIGFEAFDVIVAGDEVEHAKPHPQPYLKAADLLGVDIRDCVAIEDSEPGVASATASGAATIGIPLNSPLTSESGYTIWPTLAGRTVPDLAGVLAARRPAGNDA